MAHILDSHTATLPSGTAGCMQGRRSKPASSAIRCITLTGLLFLLSGCSLFKDDDPPKENDPGQNPPGQCSPGSCIGTQEFLLTGAGSQDDPCVFDPVVIQCSNCVLNKLELRSRGAALWPTGVVFEKDGVTSERSLNGPGPNDPSDVVWTANTNALACSTPLGCADGTYTVRLKQTENPSLCADFGSVTLTAVLL